MKKKRSKEKKRNQEVRKKGVKKTVITVLIENATYTMKKGEMSTNMN